MRTVIIGLLVGAIALGQSACRNMMSEEDAGELGLTADNPLWAWLAPEHDPEPDEDEPAEETAVDGSYWVENNQSYYDAFYGAYYDQWYYSQYYGRWYCEICDAWHYPQSYDLYYYAPDEDGEDNGD